MYISIYIYIYIYTHSPVQTVFIKKPFQDNMRNPKPSSKTWRSSGVAYSRLGRVLRATPIEKQAESFPPASKLITLKGFTAQILLQPLGRIMSKSLMGEGGSRKLKTFLI